jgi:hypothetical protein
MTHAKLDALPCIREFYLVQLDSMNAAIAGD